MDRGVEPGRLLQVGLEAQATDGPGRRLGAPRRAARDEVISRSIKW